MDILIKVLTVVIALLHLYFLYFEMFAWETTGRKIFRSLPKDIFPKTKSMAANQGLYNGFLVAGLLWPLFISDPEWSRNILLFFLGCVSAAGLYGGMTVDKKIFFVQALPALVTIVLVLLAG